MKVKVIQQYNYNDIEDNINRFLENNPNINIINIIQVSRKDSGDVMTSIFYEENK